ncbi:MAG: FAD/NAD(P)-binding oxidoreductase [Eggerthellaceae bacterium]|nr:FAD/NAD(P)-binding oxidoreductase [Eggerthellaceae bacterium]
MTQLDQTSQAEATAATSAACAAEGSEETRATEATAAAAPTHVRVALVGFGTAGVNAAIALRNAGYAGDIHAFSDTATPPYSPILTSYYAGGEKTYDECFPWSADELADLHVTVHTECPVLEIDPELHLLHTTRGAFTYEKCLIATGAHPSTVGFPQVESAKGIESADDAEGEAGSMADNAAGYEPLVLRTLDDAVRLRAALERESCTRVLVSGASMVALKALEACLRHGVATTLVGMNPHVLDMTALPPAAERFERGLRAKGVELRLGQTIASVRVVGKEAGANASGGNASDGAIASSGAQALEVTFSNGETAAFDEIIVAHGVRSNLGFVQAGSLKIDRALVVDEFMRTSDPDVYAAGDVAQALELVSGEKRVVGIWKSAAVQGACAGTAMATELAGEKPAPSCAYAGGIATNTIAVDGTLFISAGSVEEAENRRVEVRETDDMTVVYVFEVAADGAERLVGFNITCDHDEPGSPAYDTGAMLTLRIESGCHK